MAIDKFAIVCYSDIAAYVNNPIVQKGERTMKDEIAIKAWCVAVEAGGDPEEWRGLLKLTWEELIYADATVVAKAMVNKYRKDMLEHLPEPVRPYVVITVAKHRHSTGDSTGTASATAGRGKAYQPRLDKYVWVYKGKEASISRQGDGWMAKYDGQSLGVYPSHTQAIEAIYRANGVTASINTVKLARMREQEAEAGISGS
jgi:hypothetical protein